ncbi:DUF2461 domain-containing protein [Daejeonella sp. H1SJ63]|jgi:uncharacterized protein (TIGR02453 family)|uniref:DUF2461 domain-containing protein n=1 Tax=Daejeonella sp. H1SJ63 TaxID=3034145 RepID=UPI0023EC5691|nr:DUF2461 domain-containing protein [Daejeonella sp. H1SJ63]
MIKVETFDFLNDLACNNERNWFHLNKARHDAARKDVLNFTAELIQHLSQIDPLIPESLDPGNCVMRIYRDIRFSKDKTPYKENFGAGISPNGKNFIGPGYYLHIQPDKCFIAGGCWMPEPELLRSIRQEIDYNGADLHTIIDNSAFKGYYGVPESDYKLKTAPKGYDADHPDVELLKLKSFTFSHKLSDKILMSPDAIKEVVNGFQILHPFIAFLRNAVS